MTTMTKIHEYCNYTFKITVHLNHKVEKRIDGKREHKVIVFNTTGAYDYCHSELVETVNLEEHINLMIEDAEKWVDNKINGDKSPEQLILISMGFN